MTDLIEDAAANPLLDFVLGLLTPLLMTGAITDLARARRAAHQAIEAYAGHPGTLLTAAQIVAFSVTAIDTLRLSMQPDLSLSMKLKLRGNANALSRASRHATEALETTSRPKPPQSRPVVPSPPADTAPKPASLNQQHWAGAMQAVAAELRTNDANLTPAQRQSNALWQTVLTEVANDLKSKQKP